MPVGFVHHIPALAYQAYHQAAADRQRVAPECGLPWELLAAIGWIESRHADGNLSPDGTASEPIFGPVLRGAPDIATVPDTDDGLLDHDTVWDRAVGPMQFIPSTWKRWASSVRQGVAVPDPQNIFDATETAAAYLCAGGRDLSNPVQRDQAILSYNPSTTYLRDVLAQAQRYATGKTDTVSQPVAPVAVNRPTAAVSISKKEPDHVSASAQAPESVTSREQHLADTSVTSRSPAQPPASTSSEAAAAPAPAAPVPTPPSAAPDGTSEGEPFAVEPAAVPNTSSPSDLSVTTTPPSPMDMAADPSIPLPTLASLQDVNAEPTEAAALAASVLATVEHDVGQTLDGTVECS